MVKSDHLPGATTVASLTILLSSAGVMQMHGMQGPEVRVVPAKAMTIRAVLIVVVIVMGRPMVRSMPRMLMSGRGTPLVSLKGIKQGHLVIISIRLMRLSQKQSLGTAPWKV